MSALDELKKINPVNMTMLEFVVTQAEYSEVSGNAEHAAAELAALKARVEELEARNREWLESYDITMPCGHKNRYLLTNGRGELVKDYRGDCVCVLCQLEKADEIEAAMKVAE